MKHLKASSGVQTGGSPRTLKEVFTSTGQLVFFLGRHRSLDLLALPASNCRPTSRVCADGGAKLHPLADRARRGSQRAVGRPALGARAQLSVGVRRTACPESLGGVLLCPHVSAAAAFRRPPPANAQVLRSRRGAPKPNSCWSSRERTGCARRPLEGIASEHDGERPHTLSVAIPPVRSVLRGMSMTSRH